MNESDAKSRRSAFSVTIGFVSMTKTLSSLTTQLGPPSLSFSIGDNVQSRSGIHKRERGVWQLKSADEIASDDLQDHINWLLQKIERCHPVVKEDVPRILMTHS
jgi:hypothetical protein